MTYPDRSRLALVLMSALFAAAMTSCGREKLTTQTVTVAPGADAGSLAEADAGSPAEGDAAGIDPGHADGAGGGTVDESAVDASSAEDSAGAAAVDGLPAGDTATGEIGADERPTDTGVSEDDLCPRICAVLLATDCPPDAAKCQAGCATDLAGACGNQARAFYGCEVALSAADFSCDARGRIHLSPGKCDEADSRFVDCLLGGTL